MMVTEVSISGTAFRVGLPRELFTQRTLGQRAFDIDADGKRFLLVARPQQLAAEDAPNPLTVVLNWPSTFRK
jgi:hypothetical protein